MKKYLIMLFVAAAAAFQSCDNNDDLWDEIDDLKSRVQALETQVNALNGNIEALDALYDGAAVSDVDITDGKATITLVNGEILTLVTVLSDVNVLVPSVSIIDGYWYYTIGDGEPVPLGVKAVAEDAKAPQFQVSEEGVWQVNLGDGKWQDVYYADTTDKVYAITTENPQDKFFEDVSVSADGSYLNIKMLTGETLSVPIVKNFLCQIVDEQDGVIEGVQIFDANEIKTFKVNMRGVENSILTAPEGWKVEMSEPTSGENELQVYTMTVTAPAPASTRATASTEKDISILATSGKYSCIAKIQVESTGIDINAPRITVANSTDVEPTYSSLTFVVELTNATTWKYLCLPSDQQAPSADQIMEQGEAMTSETTSVTVDELNDNTAYTIYVVAYDDDAVSVVASVENRTKVAPVNYYEKGVEIDGTIYSKDSPGARLLEYAANASQSDLQITLPGQSTVSFIGKNESAYNVYTKRDGGATITKDHIFIGCYSDERPVIEIGNYIPLRNVGGTVAFKNLIIDGTKSSLTNKLFDIAGNATQTGGLGTLIFEDCEIIFSQSAFITLYNAGASSINHIIFRRCKIAYTGSADTNYLIQANQTNLTGQSGFQSIVFEDNVIYKKDESLGSHFLFHGYALNNNNPVSDFSNLAFTFTHNTVVNFLPNSGQNALIVANSCASYTDISNNIYYSSPSFSRSFSNLFAIRMMGGNPESSQIGSVQPNIAYGDFGGKLFNNYYGGTSLTVFDESPFSDTNFNTGTFIKTAEAAAYGSSLDNE